MEEAKERKERVVSRPIGKPYRAAVRAYLDWKTGEGVTDDGRAFRTLPRAPLSRVLSDAPPEAEQLYVCGPERPEGDDGAGGYVAWGHEAAVFETWADRGSHWERERPALRLMHRDSGRKLNVYSASAWFPEGPSPRAMRTAFGILEGLLRERFKGARVLPTPASTGLDLWDRRRKGDYPVLSAELRATIRGGMTQGRIQTLFPEGEALPGFYYLDRRFAYAAFAAGAPVGEPEVDERPEYEPYRPGFYLVLATVPAGWDHLGLLPAKEENDGLGRKRWRYPDDPGESFEAWATFPELAVLERFGWLFEVRRRILFREPGRGGMPPDPLKNFRDGIAELRDRAALMVERGEASPEIAGMVADGLRGCFLFALGSFHGAGREETRVLKRGEDVPPEGMATLDTSGSVWTYTTSEERDPREAYRHPEWSAYIYGKTRASMLHIHTRNMKKAGYPAVGLLTLPRKDVLAIRTDALYLSSDPGWPETGMLGEMRLKGAVRESVPAPKTDAELYALRDLSVAALESEREA